MNNEETNIPAKLTPMQRVKQVYAKAVAKNDTDTGKWYILKDVTGDIIGENGSANGAWKNAADNLPDFVGTDKDGNTFEGRHKLSTASGEALDKIAEDFQHGKTNTTNLLREVAPNFTVSGMSDAAADDFAERIRSQARVTAKQTIINAGYTYHPVKQVGLDKWQLTLYKNGDPEITITRDNEQTCWEAVSDAITAHEMARRRLEQMNAAKQDAATAPLPDVRGSVSYEGGAISISQSQEARERAMGRVNGISKLMSDSARKPMHKTSRQLERKALRDAHGYKRNVRTGAIIRG